MDEARLPHGHAIEEFVDLVEEAKISGVERLVLFGSVARATHTEESDVDLLAAVHDDVDVQTTEKRLRDIAYDVLLERGVVLSIHAVAESTFERRSGHPFLQTVRAEDKQYMVERQYVEEEFTKAEQALADAERLLEGGSDEGVSTVSTTRVSTLHRPHSMLTTYGQNRTARSGDSSDGS